MLCKFEDKKENFGKKGEVLRDLDNLLCDEPCVYVPKTLILPISFFDKNIKSRILNNDVDMLSDAEKQELLIYIRNFFGDKKIVIRSSASCEDSILFTNSGQYDSFLNLTTDDEIIDAINKTYRSFISNNAIKYYEINDIDIEQQAMAVLIQEVAPVKKAGVMFTANPITGENKPIIEYCNGLGEEVVSGKKKVITIKDDYSNIDEIFYKLMSIGKKIEEKMGCPQDIEWGIDGDNIYIFQARPIIFNKKENTPLNIELPKTKIKGKTISMGIAVGIIDNGSIVLQNGNLTSKDLIPLLNCKAVILNTGGYLSHFANIIREFNKPAIIIDEKIELEEAEIYVVDGYNEMIYKLNDLNFSDIKKVYYNYFYDFLINDHKNNLDSYGICSYEIYIDSKMSEECILDESNKSIYIDGDLDVLKISFDTAENLNNFVDGFIDEGSKTNDKIYRRLFLR